MSVLSSESGKINRWIFDFEKPKTYLSLMSKVGDSGKYQKNILAVFALNWFVTGIILLSNIFLFRKRIYDCQLQGLLLNQEQCLSFVCSLDQNQRKYYQSPSQNSFSNVATLYNLQCYESLPTILTSTAVHIGAILGFLAISLIADNKGRKTALIIAWSICTFGSLMVVFGFNIIVVTIGLFLSGFGGDAANSLTFLFFCEVVNNSKRQKYSIIMQIFFTLGALAATTLFYLVSDWRIIWSILVIVPALIELVVLVCYILETPHFLLKQGCAAALTALNKIGMINLERRQTLEEEDIENVMDYQMMEDLKSVVITHLDLCKFNSLRLKTILCSLIAFALFGMYYGPVLIANSIGLNIYKTSYIVLGTQMLIYIPTYVSIEKIKRKWLGIVLLSIAVLCSLITTVVNDPVECGLCMETAVQIILIILFRAVISFFFSFFEIYISEIFPSRVRGLGFGIISAAGSLSSALTPTILSLLLDNTIDALLLFSISGVMAASCLTLLPETMGVPLQQEIDEVEMHKVRKHPGKFQYDHNKKWTSELKHKLSDNRMIQSDRY